MGMIDIKAKIILRIVFNKKKLIKGSLNTLIHDYNIILLFISLKRIELLYLIYQTKILPLNYKLF